MKQFVCGSVVRGCQAVFRARDDAGIFAHVAEHAHRDHGLETVSPALVDAVRQNITAVAS